MIELKAAKNSNVRKLAGAIAGTIKDENEVSVVSIGTEALYKAVKAVYIATSFLKRADKELKVTPVVKGTVVSDKKTEIVHLICSIG